MLDPSQWLSETINLLLMDKSNNPHLTFVLISRIFFIGIIIIPFAVVTFDIYERTKRTTRWDMAGIGRSIFDALRIILLGSVFWTLVNWALCYVIGIPPPWETLLEFAKQFR
jgi:hypothetical protein